MRYCTRCVCPSASAIALTFDEHGVCSACRVAAQRDQIDWGKRFEMLTKLVGTYKSDTGYDIIIPVSGGKDSYWQTHVAVKMLGLKPLLVTYHGNNYLDEGEYNLQRMRTLFDCDHIIMKPSEELLIKMNRIGFLLQGDMNWHAHCGIYSFPIQIAARFEIPLMLWGEHGHANLGGMHSYNDFIEFTAKFRKEHTLRGYDWHDFTDAGLDRLGRSDLKEGILPKDMCWATYPDDETLDRVGIRGIHLSNFSKWMHNEHTNLVKKEYNWRPYQGDFERTYRKSSNLDDMHENGIHDYLKFIKFGYGRGTDHACKDIRDGLMTRDEGIEMVKKYDSIKPGKDLMRWLEYVDMTEEYFDMICDTFRAPRVWRIENGRWVKDNIWGEPSEYGPVHLPKKAWDKYSTKTA